VFLWYMQGNTVKIHICFKSIGLLFVLSYIWVFVFGPGVISVLRMM
jgi:hypothetical protein